MKQRLKRKVSVLAAIAVSISCLGSVSIYGRSKVQDIPSYEIPAINGHNVTFNYDSTTGKVITDQASIADDHSFKVNETYVSPQIDGQNVTINYFNPDAGTVTICGAGSELGLTWDPANSVPMEKDERGFWHYTFKNVPYGQYTYKLVVDGDKWLLDPSNALKDGDNSLFKLEDPNAPKVTEPEYTSPILNGSEVTLSYFNASAKNVYICGTIPGTSWNPAKGSAFEMQPSDKPGLWTYTSKLDPGSYQYKFVINGSDWKIDPKNALVNNENSALIVPGLANKTIDAEPGKTTKLPELDYFEEGQVQAKSVKPDYTLDQNLEGVTLSGDQLTVASGVNAEVILNASYKGQKAKVTIKVGKLYTYKIHYYEEGSDYSDRSLWIWEPNKDGAQKFFDQAIYTDSLGRKWATSEQQYASDQINMMVRAKANWDFKDEEHKTDNQNAIMVTKGKDEVEVWIISGDPKNYYEEPGQIQDRSRTVIIEMTKPEKDYDAWEIYSWTTKKGNTHVGFNNMGNVGVAQIPISAGTENFSFVIPNVASTKEGDWIKDLPSDRAFSTPLDQQVIKARLTFGKPEITLLPFNVGYELDPGSHTIHFYYRDDALFKNNALQTLKYVQVMINGNIYDMTYNAENERYEYDFDQAINNTTYLYSYIVEDEKGVTHTYLDAFNPATQEDQSMVVYKELEASIEANVSPSSIDYDQNAVLNVNANFKYVTSQAGLISKAYADLSQLGGKKEVAIDPELMALTIAVTDQTTSGEKQIPVTVVDKYNKKHMGMATVTVNTRVASKDDFDWDEAVIYFMETDRFNDGDKSNNTPYQSEGVEDYDVNDPGKYHGGDLKGVTEKLDYLKGLGVNTIWISPIVENVHQNVYADDDHTSYYAYHGYWALNFEKLNPHLGTIADLHELIDQAHARNMKIMVDVVVNHAGYDLREGDKSIRYGRAGYPTESDWKRFAGLFRDKALNKDSNDILSDQSGMPDFATEDAKVRDQIVNWQAAWVSTLGKTAKGNSIDYFRVDTVKHVDKTTWLQFKNVLTQINPAFKMIGEYYGAGASNNFGYLNSGTMDSLLDFGFKSTASDFVNGNIDGSEAALETRNQEINNTATLGQFLSSHDEDGLLSRLGGDQGKFMVAASLQMTAKGQPVIYYGEEIGLTGKNDYPVQTNRYDFDWSKANDENQMLGHYKKILAARNAYAEIFAKGSREKVAGGNAQGYLVFKRTYNGQSVLVGLNNKEQQQVTLSLGSNGNFKDLYSGTTYTSDAKGEVTITLPSAKDGGTVMIPLMQATSINQWESRPSRRSDEGSVLSSSSSNSKDQSSQSTTTPTTKDELKNEKKDEVASAINKETPFVDIENSWAKDYIHLLVEKGIIKGVDATHFAPQNKVTRAEFATFICRMLKLEPKQKTTSFKDVKVKAWYEGYVEAVKEAGLIKGYSDGSFKPDSTISREEMIVILIRAYEYATGKTVEVPEGTVLNMQDQAQISSWAATSVLKGQVLGLITGNEKNELNPQQKASRAEVAKVIAKLMEADEKAA